MPGHFIFSLTNMSKLLSVAIIFTKTTGLKFMKGRLTINLHRTNKLSSIYMREISSGERNRQCGKFFAVDSNHLMN